MGASGRAAWCLAGDTDRVDGQVAVVGATALCSEVDQAEQAVGDLLRAAVPAGVGLRREEADLAAGMSHQRLEALHRLAVAFAVDVDDRPVARPRRAVGEAQVGLSLSRASGAGVRDVPPRLVERDEDALAAHRQQPGAAQVEAKEPLPRLALLLLRLSPALRAAGRLRSSRFRLAAAPVPVAVQGTGGELVAAAVGDHQADRRDERERFQPGRPERREGGVDDPAPARRRGSAPG